MNRDLISSLIRGHEGTREAVYKDSAGILTAGVGWNLDAADAPSIAQAFNIDLEALKNGTESLSTTQIDDVFDYQLSKVIRQLQGVFPEWETMPDNAQAVCVDLGFNLGLGGFLKFQKFIACVKNCDWAGAVNQLVDSAWLGQVKNRAEDDIALLKEIA